jgi:formylglycine-generating enzyme required for sulfatase activity
MMTNWEWSAIVLWCIKNGFQPRGNTVSGKSDAAAWRHDGTYQGISDLVGNVWEWQDGFKIVNGEVFMPNDNDFNLLEANWPNQTPGQVVFGNTAASASGWRTQTTAFGSLSASTIQKLAQAALVPNLTSGGTPMTLYNTLQGGLWITKTGEMMPLRGGRWNNGATAGLGALDLTNARSYVATGIGFRLSCIL